MSSFYFSSDFCAKESLKQANSEGTAVSRANASSNSRYEHLQVELKQSQKQTASLRVRRDISLEYRTNELS